MSENSKVVEVTYSQRKSIRNYKIIPLISSILFLNILLPLLCIYIMPVSLEGSMNRCLKIFLFLDSIIIVFFSIALKIVYNNLKPFIFSRFLITKSSIDVFLGDKLFQQFFWNNISKIEILKWIGRYQINIISKNESNLIWLDILIQSLRKHKLIRKSLKYYAKELSIEIKELKLESYNQDERRLELKKIKEFLFQNNNYKDSNK